MIHAFPDEFHLENLEPMLTCIENLSKKCDIKLIYILLMERFAEYSKNIDNTEELKDENGDTIPKKT